MRHAFSLLEMVITMMIIAIVAAIAVPRMSGGEGTRLQAVEARLASELRAAGESARANGRSRSCVIDPSTDRLLIYEGSAGSAGALLAAVNLNESPYGIDVTASTIPATPGYLVVDGYGVFQASVKVSVAAGSVSRTISISLTSAVGDGVIPLSGGGI